MCDRRLALVCSPHDLRMHSFVMAKASGVGEIMVDNNGSEKVRTNRWHLAIDAVVAIITVLALVVSFYNLNAARQSARAANSSAAAAQEANRLLMVTDAFRFSAA